MAVYRVIAIISSCVYFFSAHRVHSVLFIDVDSALQILGLQFWGVVVNLNLWKGEAVGGRGWYRSKERL